MKKWDSKKRYSFMAIIAALFLMAGCGTQSKNSSSSSSSSTSTSKSTSTSSTQTSTSKPTSQSSSTSSKSQSSPKENPPKQAPVQQTRLETLNSAMKARISGIQLPTVLNTNGQTLNAALTGDAANYRADYRLGGTAAGLNAAGVNYANSDLALQKVTYASQAGAQSAAQVGYQSIQGGLPTVDLGDNQKATQEGAAGSLYTVWHEGNWSITVIGSNVSGQNGTALAKQAVALFKMKALPAPDGLAVVTLYANRQSGRQNRITYRKGNALFVMGGNDPMLLLNAATSLK